MDNLLTPSKELKEQLLELDELLNQFIELSTDNENYLNLKKIISPLISLKEDKICYRFRIEDIGSPKKTKDGFKIQRVMFYDSDCEESLIPHTNIHGHMNKDNKIKKIKDGEYEDFKGKSAWKSKKVKEDLVSEGGGEKIYWIHWKTPHFENTITPGKPIEFMASIFPDEESDYVDQNGNWSSLGKAQLEKAKNTLNKAYKNKEFTSIEIDISYNCGSPRSLTGANCEKRAKNAVENTIKRLYELGLKMPIDVFNKKTIDAFQDENDRRGIEIKIIPHKK